MGQFIQFLLERAPNNTQLFKVAFVGELCATLGLTHMGRGGGPRLPMLDEIRVKPNAKDTDKQHLLQQIKQFVTSYAGGEEPISHIMLMQNSPHSSKYSSIQFKRGADTYDIVLASGANKGESFEKAVVDKIEKWLHAEDEADVENMLIALSKVDPTITSDTVAQVRKAGGSSKRPENFDHSGSVIADFVFMLKDGTERFVSLKDKNGGTFANIGGGARTLIDPTTYAVNKDNSLAELLLEVGFDLARIQQGYDAYVTKQPVSFDYTQSVTNAVEPSSRLGQIMQHGWGTGYIYLREDPKAEHGWFAMSVTTDTLQSNLLKNLVVTQIRYPHTNSKQIAVDLGNSEFKYRLEIRNSKGGLLPTEVKIRIV